MKKICLLFLICAFHQYVNAQDCSFAPFTSQKMVDIFRRNNAECKSLSELVISGPDITNLDSLSGITSINGNLWIIDNPNLTDLSGLAGITSIYANLRIEENAKLASLKGLNSVKKISNLSIKNNAALINLSGLDSVSTFWWEIKIENNPSLTSLDGLQSLSGETGIIKITNNSALTSIEALHNINRLYDSLLVTGNPSLESLSGLHSISGFVPAVFIQSNDKLLNLDGLRSLGGTNDMYITNNPLLEDLLGLKALRSVHSLNVINNDNLTSLAGLDRVTYGGYWKFQNCAKLTSCATKNVCLLLNSYDGLPQVTFGSNAPGCNSRDEVRTLCNSFPVELINFSAENKADGNALKWTTASETRNKGFEVESSPGGRTFKKIGFVEGNTDSHEMLHYSFTDSAPHASTYYRLKQLDWDETATYSKIVVVRAKQPTVAVYPNPARGRIMVRAENLNQPYSIKNKQGVTVMESAVLPEKEITTESLQDGIYFLTVGSEVFKILVAND